MASTDGCGNSPVPMLPSTSNDSLTYMDYLQDPGDLWRWFTNKPPKQPAKTCSQRNKEYRARKKALKRAYVSDRLTRRALMARRRREKETEEARALRKRKDAERAFQRRQKRKEHTVTGVIPLSAPNSQPPSDTENTLSELCTTTTSIMDIECLDILDDDDDIKEMDDHPDSEMIYECDFDIGKVIDDCLSNLDVKLQIREAISAKNSTLDQLVVKQKTIRDIYGGLSMQINKLERFTQTNVFPSEPEHAKVSSAIITQHSTSKIEMKTKGSDNADVIPLLKITNRPSQLPPPGELFRKELLIGSKVHAMKNGMFGIWNRGRIIEIKYCPKGGPNVYRVKLESRKGSNFFTSGKHLAYGHVADVALKVGTRVIAQYKDEYFLHRNSMYAGVIAEPLSVMNKYRYLVFFDDGYAQYVQHGDVRVVYEFNPNVWEDVHPDSKEFIRNYLKQYPERPMVKLQKNHVVKTEWNGKWWISKVVMVDGSLVKIYFQADRRTEWIYRGSTRLGPLFTELANAEAVRLSGNCARRHNLAIVKRSAPYVEYTRGLEESTASAEEVDCEEEDESILEQSIHRQSVAPSSPRQTARKSTSVVPVQKRLVLPPKSVENEGTIESVKSATQESRRPYKEHGRCKFDCIREKCDDPALFKGRNPLCIPSFCGWERQIVKYKNNSKLSVFYRAPCGRRLRNLDEIYKYLRNTNSKLTIDLFCMEDYVHCDGQFKPSKIQCYIKDISYGRENIRVSGVNSFNRDYPDYLEYSTNRIPNKGVNLNLDPEFLVCCSCTDNCSDRAKCECQRLTVEATGVTRDGQVNKDAGYYYRRLQYPILTGLYECNSRCKCSSQCMNRVVQHGLTLRLQVFKTEKRGWGIRCIDDIPKGGFICTYAGQLLTEQGANEDGTQFGDEYLAELDYIEVIERQKEGYESDVVDPDDEDDEDNDDKDNTSVSSANTKDSGKKSRHRMSDSRNDDNDVDDVEYSSAKDEKDSDYESSDIDPAVQRVQPTRSVKETMKRDSSPEKLDGVSTETDDNGKIKDSTKPSKSNQNRRSMESIVIDSDSEDDSSKTSVASSFQAESTSQENSTAPSQSKYKPLPTDVCKKDATKKSYNTGLTTEPGIRPKYQSSRRFFGDKFCYIMDAKSLGNIGRYLNHSCNPNAFVQNVFVDTHDLRFPWVTFFALHYIRAGSELTWDYNYEVGSVPNKVLYCYCGAKECRGRLL